MANRQRKSERDESLQKDDAEERKKRRMLSNRESARRSRLRKQQHLDDLRSHVTQMRSEKSEMLARFSLTSRQLAQISTENQSLHSQAMELQAKLHELIVLSSSASSTSASDSFHHRDQQIFKYNVADFSHPFHFVLNTRRSHGTSNKASWNSSSSSSSSSSSFLRSIATTR